MTDTRNIDPATVSSFGDEWSRHRQSNVSDAELQELFQRYFCIFPWDKVGPDAVGFDMGVGSGRWARMVAPRVGKLHVIDASPQALSVAQENLRGLANVEFINATTDTVPLEPMSCDFGYSLGVLHHIPDTPAALKDCVRLLKPGGVMLVYLYYKFDNRPLWFRLVWAASDLLRRGVHRLPPRAKALASDLIALGVYWPLSRLAGLVSRLGGNPDAIPLGSYRSSSLATLRTDSRDRFGTPLEQRFSRVEIDQMMRDAGLTDIRFSDSVPYWCAVGVKA